MQMHVRGTPFGSAKASRHTVVRPARSRIAAVSVRADGQQIQVLGIRMHSVHILAHLLAIGL